MRIVLCCGDRNWDDAKKIYRILKHEHKKRPIDFVIEGGALGADYLSRVVAEKLGIQVVECPANWEYFGKKAGPIRNTQQLRLALELACEGGQISGSEQKMNMIVFAFHSNIKQSKGTKNMVEQAKKANVKVKIIK
jgi:hypothetical protein